jgi:arylsulfatase A-like enzyme
MGDANVVEWARAFLEEEHAAPFFLAVGLYRPHLPWYVPSAYFERLPSAGVSLPPVPLDPLAGVPAAGRRLAGQDHARVLASGNWARAVRGYLASIAFADDMVGRLLAALDASRYGGNTVIVVWGDHGWHLGEKAHWRKFALWEEATRVPLAIVAPGVSRAETRCARTVSLLDLYPTLVELCGLPPREELEGRSLIPLLREPAAAWDRPVVTTHGHRNHAVRTERWRYIRYADGSEELYDHDADPLEWENLAGESRFATVKEELARSLPKRDAPPAPRRQAQAAEEREEEEP